MKRVWLLGVALAVVTLLAVPVWRYHRVQLTLTPSNFVECGNPTRAVLVRWHVGPAVAQPLHLFVNGIGKPEQLWAAVGAKGKQTTGDWMNDGSSVTLRDAQGHFLARRTITAWMPMDAQGNPLDPRTVPQCRDMPGVP